LQLAAGFKRSCLNGSVIVQVRSIISSAWGQGRGASSAPYSNFAAKLLCCSEK